MGKRWTALGRASVLLLASGACAAAGNTNWAVPTQVDVVRNEGMMVWGNFGNPGSCTEANAFFVQIGHPQYAQIYSMVMTAFVTGKSIQGYIYDCNPETWYTVSSVTWNSLDPGSSVYMSQ